MTPYTWFDVLLVVVIAAATVVGLIRGFVRGLVGIIAALAGFVLAANYYQSFSEILTGLISHRRTREFISFGLIFIIILVLGYLLSRAITHRFSGLSRFFDHLFGGGVGFLKGTVFCGAVIVALTVFLRDQSIVLKSRLTPAALRVTQALIEIVPKELRDQFYVSYKKVLQMREGGADGKESR